MLNVLEVTLRFSKKLAMIFAYLNILYINSFKKCNK